jgi:hypothetical protein
VFDLRSPAEHTSSQKRTPAETRPLERLASQGSRLRCRVSGGGDMVEVGRDLRPGQIAIRWNDCGAHSAAADSGTPAFG